MRPLIKTLLLVLGIIALLVVSKGFPQFKAVLKFLFLSPIGILAIVLLLGYWIYRIRLRAAYEAGRITNDTPKRIPPPPPPPAPPDRDL